MALWKNPGLASLSDGSMQGWRGYPPKSKLGMYLGIAVNYFSSTSGADGRGVPTVWLLAGPKAPRALRTSRPLVCVL